MAVYFSVLIYVQSNSFSTSRKIDLLSFILLIVKRVKKWYAIKSQNIIKKNFGVKCVRMRTRFISSFSTTRKYTFFFTLALIQTYATCLDTFTETETEKRSEKWKFSFSQKLFFEIKIFKSAKESDWLWVVYTRTGRKMTGN